MFLYVPTAYGPAHVCVLADEIRAERWHRLLNIARTMPDEDVTLSLPDDDVYLEQCDDPTIHFIEFKYGERLPDVRMELCFIGVRWVSDSIVTQWVSPKVLSAGLWSMLPPSLLRHPCGAARQTPGYQEVI